MSGLLTYEKYKNRLLVRGEKEKYKSCMKKLEGRWYENLKGKSGWSLPDYKEKQLMEIIEDSNAENSLSNIKSQARPRKEQNKYHRAISEDEDSSNKSESEKSEEGENSSGVENNENPGGQIENDSDEEYFAREKERYEREKYESI